MADYFMKSILLPLVIGLSTASLSIAQDDLGTINLDTYSIVAERSFESTQLAGYQLDQNSIVLKDALTLDQALRTLPSVDTYRDIASLNTPPPTQGVRFRNTAANATSRALVLIDGVPLNEPFGGWIYWNKLPGPELDSLSVNSIGSISSWGNYGSGGIIHAVTQSAFEPTTNIQTQIGSFDTWKASLYSAQALSKNAALSIELRSLDTQGYYGLGPKQRGSIDRTLASDYSYAKLKLANKLNALWQSILTVSYYEESKRNGTPLNGSNTESIDLAWSLQKTEGTQSLSWTTFFQDTDFANTFTSVDATRTTEREVLDQFDVPGQSIGSQITWSNEYSDKLNLLAGADIRLIKGHASERFRNLGNGFTRRRNEGGEQTFAGAFITAQKELSDNDTLEATLRFDYWRQHAGFRNEFNLETNEQTRDDFYAGSSGTEPVFNLKYTRTLNENWNLGALIFRGFRAPTLNELYRPYRVRNDIVESNPGLTNETTWGGELNLSYSDDKHDFQISAFNYQIDDMIANVFIHDTPGFDPLGGFIPSGGSLSHRNNLQKSEVSGFEIAWIWTVTDTVEIHTGYLFTDTHIKQAPNPILDSNEFPLAPKGKLSSALTWTPSENWLLSAQALYRTSQYDNILNTRSIPDSLQVNFSAHYTFPDTPWSLSTSIQNAFNEEIITAISSSDLITHAAPQSFWFSVNYSK